MPRHLLLSQLAAETQLRSVDLWLLMQDTAPSILLLHLLDHPACRTPGTLLATTAATIRQEMDCGPSREKISELQVGMATARSATVMSICTQALHRWLLAQGLVGLGATNILQVKEHPARSSLTFWRTMVVDHENDSNNECGENRCARSDETFAFSDFRSHCLIFGNGFEN